MKTQPCLSSTTCVLFSTPTMSLLTLVCYSFLQRRQINDILTISKTRQWLPFGFLVLLNIRKCFFFSFHATLSSFTSFWQLLVSSQKDMCVFRKCKDGPKSTQAFIKIPTMSIFFHWCHFCISPSVLINTCLLFFFA